MSGEFNEYSKFVKSSSAFFTPVKLHNEFGGSMACGKPQTNFICIIVLLTLQGLDLNPFLRASHCISFLDGERKRKQFKRGSEK